MLGHDDIDELEHDEHGEREFAGDLRRMSHAVRCVTRVTRV